MPNQIVAIITRIDPPVEKLSAAELLRQHSEGITIVFEGEQSTRLYPGDRAVGLLEILDGLRQLRTPAYVELDPDTQAITRLLIPLVTRVAAISEEEETEEVEIELEASHARHLLKRSHPDFERMLGALGAAQERNAWLIVTETDEHGIIDVRPSPHEPRPAEPAAPERHRGSSWFRRFCRWCSCAFRCCFRRLRCVSTRRAQQLFDLVSATSCDPLAVPPPCIPFLYPDDGCWARAHEMCRLMIAVGARPRKVWIDGSLHVQTKNNPSCQVFWGWHVAPTLCVRRRSFRVEEMVIDPSLFSGPVSLSTWKGVQGDPNATLTATAASVYWRHVMPTDPNYVDTNFRLQYYRLQLKNRSLQPAGPPPYAYCP